MRDEQQCSVDSKHTCSNDHADGQSSDYLRGIERIVQTEGRGRSERGHAGGEVCSGFFVDAVASNRLNCDRGEDSDAGCVSGRSERFGNRNITFTLPHRDSRSGEGNGWDLQRRWTDGDFAVHHREYTCSGIHDHECIGRSTGGVNCSALHADQSDGEFAGRKSDCAAGRI